MPLDTVQGIGEDTEDDLGLATAIAGQAEYLVTGDRHLQGIGAYEGVIIVSPRQFLTILESRELDDRDL
jgi:predicted nucleic acid-binding protein